jgi:hypothetical protein
MQPKKAATRKITKLAKEAEELAKRKADMMAPENSSSLRRSVIPPAIPSLSVQVDDLDQNSESDQMRPFPPSNPLSYAKAAEAAREAAVSSRKAPLNRLEPEEQEVASVLAAADRPSRVGSGVVSETTSRLPLRTNRSPLDNVWTNGADRLRSTGLSSVPGSIDQGQVPLNSAGSIGLQKQPDFRSGFRTEYDSSIDQDRPAVPVFNKAVFQHKLSKNAKTLLFNSSDVNQEQLCEFLDSCDNIGWGLRYSQALSLTQSIDFIPFDSLQKGMYVIQCNKKVDELTTMGDSVEAVYIVEENGSHEGSMMKVTAGPDLHSSFKFSPSGCFVAIGNRGFPSQNLISIIPKPTFNPLMKYLIAEDATRFKKSFVARQMLEEDTANSMSNCNLDGRQHRRSSSIPEVEESTQISKFLNAASLSDQAARAMKAASANTNLLANRRAFSFLLRIQKGLSGVEKLSAFDNIFGDSKGSILKSADIKSIMTARCLELSQRHLVNLSFFTIKFDSVCKGLLGGRSDTKDLVDAFFFQDFFLCNNSLSDVKSIPVRSEFPARYIKEGILYFKSFLHVCGSSSWDEPLQQFLEWACETGDSQTPLGPHSYEGPVRVFFAKMVFEKILEAITRSDFDDDIKDVQIKVSTAISSMFDTWKYDINALRDRMVHDASFYAIKESKSLDVSSEKKKKAQDADDGSESPPKKPKTIPLKKSNVGGGVGGGGAGGAVPNGVGAVKPLPSNKLANGKIRMCIYHVGSFVLPGLRTGCTPKSGKPLCDFKHLNTLDEYIDYYGSKPLCKEAAMANGKTGKMGLIRDKLEELLK